MSATVHDALIGYNQTLASATYGICHFGEGIVDVSKLRSTQILSLSDNLYTLSVARGCRWLAGLTALNKKRLINYTSSI